MTSVDMNPIRRDRRIQMSAVAGLACLALVAIGALAVAVATRPEPAIADMAQHARLSVVTEPAPKPAIAMPRDKLATLDPAQLADEARPAEPTDPALQSVLDQERREQIQALSDQRDFDARLKAELSDSPPAQPTISAEPSNDKTSTSNTEDSAG